LLVQAGQTLRDGLLDGIQLGPERAPDCQQPRHSLCALIKPRRSTTFPFLLALFVKFGGINGHDDFGFMIIFDGGSLVIPREARVPRRPPGRSRPARIPRGCRVSHPTIMCCRGLVTFRRCYHFRSFHLAFWLLFWTALRAASREYPANAAVWPSSLNPSETMAPR